MKKDKSSSSQTYVCSLVTDRTAVWVMELNYKWLYELCSSGKKYLCEKLPFRNTQVLHASSGAEMARFKGNLYDTTMSVVIADLFF